MNRRLFIVLVVALFCLANVTRAAFRAKYGEPRFVAEGAAHLRYTAMVARGQEIPVLDIKAQWPEGMRVFRDASTAMEYLYGGIYRLIPGEKPDLVSFIRFFTAFFFSLAIVPLAFLSARIWRSYGAGVFTALLFATALPLVARSSGFEYIRENVTFPLLAFHLFFHVSACRKGGIAFPALSGAFLFAALLSWHGSQFYLVPFLLFLLARGVLAESGDHERRAALALVAALFAAGVVVPYLREGRFLLSIPAALGAALLAIELAAPRILRRLSGKGKGRGKGAGANPRAVRVVVAAVVVAAVLLPGAVSGAHFESYSHFFDLVLYKLRYLQKPDDPRLLSFDARAFWVGPFNSPDARHFFVFALPILFLLPGPIALLMRRSQDRDHEALFVLAFLGIYFLLFLLMQRLLPLFAFFAVVTAGGNVFEFFPGRRVRNAARPALLLSVLVVTISLFQDFGWEGRYDFWRRAARALRVPSRDTFVVYPYARDVEGDLLAWMRDNCDRGAVVMSLHYLSPQVLTYTDRSTNLNDFFESPSVRRKAERFLTLLYGSEDALYRYCAEQASTYLLVSTAVGCDPTKESPLYQAGLINMPPACAAYRFIFEPEKLSRFDLVYENERYRLFRVGGPPRARLWPRSPLFYEKDLLWSQSGDMRDFYNAATRIYALTARGSALVARGAEREGERSLVEALHVFYFYPAWKALDGLYERRGRLAERESAASFAFGYDPNRVDVRLALAESRISLGKPEGVRDVLEGCLGLPASPRERQEAAELIRKLEDAAH